jgi:hypothetical protein
VIAVLVGHDVHEVAVAVATFFVAVTVPVAGLRIAIYFVRAAWGGR